MTSSKATDNQHISKMIALVCKNFVQEVTGNYCIEGFAEVINSATVVPENYTSTEMFNITKKFAACIWMCSYGARKLRPRTRWKIEGCI